MSFDLKTCRFVVWGYKHSYHTHGHIHDGLHRALVRTGKEAYWWDELEHGDLNRENTLFVTNHDVAHQLPIREDCFYLVHGLIDHEVKHRFERLRNRLSWNVFINTHYPIIQHAEPGRIVMLDTDMPFFQSERHFNMRWATDRTADEIEHNKIGAQTLNTQSRVINYVGTYWHVNEREISRFGQACHDHDIQLRHLGGGQADEDYSYLGHARVVSPDKNVELVRASYFAPAIVGSHHLTEGYAPCRIFKNISFGQFGVTNSQAVQDIFGGRLVFDHDPYRLFETTLLKLPIVGQAALYELMDQVAERHTYVRRWERIFRAVEMTQDLAL